GDFKDTFKAGFNFDTAEGEMNIENGDVNTKDFEIKSSVAKITLSGRTGLPERDYENTVVVIPNISGGAAGLTALLVNLPAGIGLWLFDKITGEQFNRATARTYEITGTWDKPIIELIELEDSL
ncbi:MAG: AsmA-like C-terminal region-containing protein, partial [Gammaproteobacteria bacterium]|nr:AsmA-like C-terminal region-containing protein [Gammaproteobacteria bacterium]